MRNSEASWRDTRKQLRKDHRWELASLLEREEKEKLFEVHLENLSKKNREMFHKLLDETQEVRATCAIAYYFYAPASLIMKPSHKI